MWVVIEKKRGFRGLKIPKRRLSLVFASEGKERQRKCLFFASRLIFYNTRLNDPAENEKKKFTQHC
jgi:hypothetical protein